MNPAPVQHISFGMEAGKCAWYVTPVCLCSMNTDSTAARTQHCNTPLIRCSSSHTLRVEVRLFSITLASVVGVAFAAISLPALPRLASLTPRYCFLG